MHLPDEGLVDPMRLTVAYARLAAANGCTVLRGAPVTGVLREGGAVAGVVTPAGTIRARFVVNAAGLGAGRVAELAGGEAFRMWPRKGEYLLVDREVGRRLRTIVFGTPLPDTKGVNVVPTTHGSLLLGPTADDHEAEDDRATDAATLDGVLASAQRLVPSLRREHVIKAYAANRPASEERSACASTPGCRTCCTRPTARRASPSRRRSAATRWSSCAPPASTPRTAPTPSTRCPPCRACAPTRTPSG